MFQKEQEPTNPKIEHIHELEWEKEEMHIQEGLQSIRRQAALTKITLEEPGTET